MRVISARAVYVHIGPYKTGTTYLQNILWRNRAALAAEGVQVPREDWPAQRRSIAQLIKRAPDLPPHAPDPRRARDAWDRLLQELDDTDAHTVILSVERLCEAEAHTVRALTESLAPATVHVVYTARDLARVIPADWQTRLRNRGSPSWADYLASVRQPAGPDTYGARFWRQHDPAATLPPYLEHVPAERLHVVTVPAAEGPRRVLWERFCAVTGLDADRYDLDVPRVNESLGGVEAEVLRRLNMRVADKLPFRAYVDVVNHFVAREVLERRAQSFRLVLPEREHEWLESRARAAVDYLGSGGFDVVGDLDELLPVRTAGHREPDDVSEPELLALTAEVLAATVAELARRADRTAPG